VGAGTNPDLISGVSSFLVRVGWSKPPLIPLVEYSSSIQFTLPPSVPTTPIEPVTMKVTLRGEAIVDNAPLTMIVDAPISVFAKGNWTIGPTMVTPDNARPVSSGMPSTQLNLRWWTTDEYGTEMWNGTETFELTTFGVFGVTIGMYIDPSPPMRDFESRTGKYVGYGGYLTIHNSTKIIVNSSEVNAAELSAERAIATGNSLAWFIIFFASLDIGFRFYDYSSDEKENHRCEREPEEP
jgi:hypothetical protein